MQFCLWCSMNSNDDVYPSGNKVITGDFNGANVCDSSGRQRQHYPPPFIHSYYYWQINSMTMTILVG